MPNFSSTLHVAIKPKAKEHYFMAAYVLFYTIKIIALIRDEKFSMVSYNFTTLNSLSLASLPPHSFARCTAPLET